MAICWRSIGLIVAVAVVGLSVTGCSWTRDNATSSFANVVGNEIDKEIDGKANRTISDPDVGTVAIATGYRLTAGLIYPEVISYAYAGIAPGFDVGATVNTGTATYSARYTYVTVDYETSIFGLSGNPRSDGGIIDLNADFAAGTLTGATSDLAVDGSINGDDLSGTVKVQYSSYYNPIIGKLDGFIGATGTIGAFHGSDNETALAGGFVGTAK